MKEIIGDVMPGNVLIAISGIESENRSTPDFDCGLAVESIFVAAQSLGLGARIYGRLSRKINSDDRIHIQMVDKIRTNLTGAAVTTAEFHELGITNQKNFFKTEPRLINRLINNPNYVRILSLNHVTYFSQPKQQTCCKILQELRQIL